MSHFGCFLSELQHFADEPLPLLTLWVFVPHEFPCISRQPTVVVGITVKDDEPPLVLAKLPKHSSQAACCVLGPNEDGMCHAIVPS